jgi:hypothetical protein
VGVPIAPAVDASKSIVALTMKIDEVARFIGARHASGSTASRRFP